MPGQEVQHNAENKLKEMIQDVTTLEVVTLSGNITIADLQVDPDKTVNFQRIMDEINGNPTTASNVKLVAATKFDFDKDVQQFVKENMTREEKELFGIHLETIKNAQEARAAIMESLLNIFRG